MTSKSVFSILKKVLALLMMAHGMTTLVSGTVPEFGSYLTAEGFPAGLALAWAITLLEITGATCILIGRLEKLAAVFFIIELTAGIILIHAKAGWFVVGPTSGGMEYNVFLIICFILVMLERSAENKDTPGD
ncbi:MAG: DoxX family protein [Chitinophagaceae bacterium]|nr:DoxX family protein [Chitinophagaceae bacterium]